MPCAEPLLGAGAVGGNGVVVDEFCRTSLPDIFARHFTRSGDFAAHANKFADGSMLRLVSVQNANGMAIQESTPVEAAAAPDIGDLGNVDRPLKELAP